MGQRLRRAAGLKFIEGLTTNMITNENIMFVVSRERRTANYVFGFSEDGRQCRIAVAGPNRSRIYHADVKTINTTPYLFMSGPVGGRRGGGYFKSCNLSNMSCRVTQFNSTTHITRTHTRFSVNNEGTIVYFNDTRNGGDLVGYNLTLEGDAFDLGAGKKM